MPLRPYQQDLKDQTLQAWDSGQRNVMLQCPTGGGKTVIKASVIEEVNAPACAIAHRRELVCQISMALAREGVRHRIIAPDPVVKFCAQLHVGQLGHSLVNQRSAQVAVAGVDTLIRPSHELDQWGKRVEAWLQDEAHHLLAENKWGRGVARFPNAFGLGVTATPTRTDGKGLGRHAHGVFDTLLLGPSPRELMRQGFLSDYRIVCARDHVDGLQAGGSGEYTAASVDKAIRKSKIVGDVVPTWLKHAYGLKTVVFTHNIEAAGEVADDFKARGIRAAVVSSKNSDAERVSLVRQFELGALDVLVNVDLFGEGFDLPALECVIMARPTASLGLYMQQFGRVLRIVAGKLWGLVIDHVGNVMRHGLPDAHREWTLDARPKRASDGPSDAIPLRTCSNVECLGAYERIHLTCPYCGAGYEPAGRSGPEQVDGDLCELDPAVLARLRGESDRFHMTPEQAGAEVRDKHGPPVAVVVAAKRHAQWQTAQALLREAIYQWCGYRKAEGLDDRQIMKLFYFKFGVDLETAKGLKLKETNELLKKLNPNSATVNEFLDPAELGELLPEILKEPDMRLALEACGWNGANGSRGALTTALGLEHKDTHNFGRCYCRPGTPPEVLACCARGFEKRDFGPAVTCGQLKAFYGLGDKGIKVKTVADWLGYPCTRELNSPGVTGERCYYCRPETTVEELYCVANGFEKQDFGPVVSVDRLRSTYGVKSLGVRSVAAWLGYDHKNKLFALGKEHLAYTREPMTNEQIREYLTKED